MSSARALLRLFVTLKSRARARLLRVVSSTVHHSLDSTTNREDVGYPVETAKGQPFVQNWYSRELLYSPKILAESASLHLRVKYAPAGPLKS